MLVLSRKKGERITVGPVTVTIVKIKGNSVRVGIDAPDDMVILRDELNENKKSAETDNHITGETN